jgi:carbamoyl-phosphate synthase small subunit
VRGPAPPAALLALEDGTIAAGRALGARGEAFGEAVFNTAMSGYQEVLTDPSYAGQVVVMTSPHQGNYGTNPVDPESGTVQVAGFCVREATRRPSSWRATTSLHDELAGAGVVGIEQVDTRRLTLRIRRGGAMRCGITTEDLSPESFLERVRAQSGMEGTDLAHGVSTAEPYEARALVGPAAADHGPVLRVAAYDFGLKRNILRRLSAVGCEVVVYPARTPAGEVLAKGYDGVFLSNGPGDPAATAYGIQTCRELLGRIPLFGICLGHQLLALALGARTYKLRFGHRGVNHPVMDLETGRIEITSHNHGFAVDPQSLQGGPAPIAYTAMGRVALTHWNLNDGTLEGLRCLDTPAFGVQFHPEAAPGPHDSIHHFDRFRELMLRAKAI